MPDPQTIRPASGLPPQALWQQVAGLVSDWCSTQACTLRDVVVLLPFVQLLDPARRAFAARGGWQPRVETTGTWAASLGPPPPQRSGDLSGSSTLDSLSAAQMLRRQAGLQAWEDADARAFHQAVGATVDTAQALHRAVHALAPAQRASRWEEALQATAAVPGGPGTLEASLARLAVEWARASPPPATNRLFGARCAALVCLRAGGEDPLADALMASMAVPSLLIDTDPAPEAPFEPALHVPAPPRLVVANGMEAEARAVAGEVIDGLNEGHRPVALIALDRALVRRVRALLDRRGVVIADETGWALSTTRAGAVLMSLLKASAPRPSHDEQLEWLKSLPPATVPALALRELEQLWRADELVSFEKTPAAAALLAWAGDTLAPLRVLGRQPLQTWLQSLAAVLGHCGAAQALALDAAGRQVLSALLIGDGLAADPAWAEALGAERLDRAGLLAWADRTLESASFVPPAQPDPDVVLTPLARAMLRPMAAAVIGGADERHLLAVSRQVGLLPEMVMQGLGLDSVERRLGQQRRALAQLLRLPRISFVHRRLDGAEPVSGSPALDAIATWRRRAGLQAWDERAPVQTLQSVTRAPLARPSPAAPSDLPARLSASTVENLRACPYRFFARSVLRLREVDELDEGVAKRDYGNWLHAVLDRFHRDRAEVGVGGLHELHAAAQAVSEHMALSVARLLPYRIGFEWLAPAYLRWLDVREAEGLHWSDGEFDMHRSPPELEGTQLRGRIDRLDRGPGRVAVLDYKTGSLSAIKAKLRDPMEDTQLPFYALLMQADGDESGHFEAEYLALDAPDAPVDQVHAAVVSTARALLTGLAADLRRLRDGAGMPALGEGSVCTSCEARGLCRRDHWEEGP